MPCPCGFLSGTRICTKSYLLFWDQMVPKRKVSYKFARKTNVANNPVRSSNPIQSLIYPPASMRWWQSQRKSRESLQFGAFFVPPIDQSAFTKVPPDRSVKGWEVSQAVLQVMWNTMWRVGRCRINPATPRCFKMKNKSNLLYTLSSHAVDKSCSSCTCWSYPWSRSRRWSSRTASTWARCRDTKLASLPFAVRWG